MPVPLVATLRAHHSTHVVGTVGLSHELHTSDHATGACIHAGTEHALGPPPQHPTAERPVGDRAKLPGRWNPIGGPTQPMLRLVIRAERRIPQILIAPGTDQPDPVAA